MAALLDSANLDLASTPGLPPTPPGAASAGSSPAAPSAIPTAQQARLVHGQHTEVLVQVYADRILVIVTQLGRIGCMVRLGVPGTLGLHPLTVSVGMSRADPSLAAAAKSSCAPSTCSRRANLDRQRRLFDLDPLFPASSASLDRPDAPLRSRAHSPTRLATRLVRGPDRSYRVPALRGRVRSGRILWRGGPRKRRTAAGGARDRTQTYVAGRGIKRASCGRRRTRDSVRGP